jgi:SAM-dependent methyltransferase
MSCCTSHCAATARHFDATIAQGDWEEYHANGLEKRASRLVDGLARVGIDGASVLDVGAGLGLVSLELLQRGAATATLCDASPAYLEGAREEARERGLTDRVRYAEGDFVDIAATIAPTDIVVLDRVVCCYPAWQPLITSAAGCCRRVLGMTYPPNRVDVRAVIGFENLRRRWSGDDFRAFVHPPSAMDGLLRSRGFRRISRARTLVWKIDVYVREM